MDKTTNFTFWLLVVPKSLSFLHSNGPKAIKSPCVPDLLNKSSNFKKLKVNFSKVEDLLLVVQWLCSLKRIVPKLLRKKLGQREYLLMEDVLFILIMFIQMPNMISAESKELSLRNLKACHR